MLRALAERLNHPLAGVWDERINAFYVQDNYPDPSLDSELERVEGGFGVTPRSHFFALREMVPGLRGIAILDNDGRARRDADEGGLQISYWSRYEAENYFITPEVLRSYVANHYGDMSLFDAFRNEANEVLDALILARIFGDRTEDCDTWKSAGVDASRLLWEAKTERVKLSDFAEEFFRRLADRLGHVMLLRKGDLHRLVAFVDPAAIPAEVRTKLDLLKALFDHATPGEEAS